MYLVNKYAKWYNSIVDRAKINRELTDVYVEKHHILPKSLGGDNSPANLVLLTAREHFICHLLLTKMLEGKDKAKMVYAAVGMANLNNGKQSRYKSTNSRLYQYLREQASLNRRGSKQSVESKRKNSASQKRLREAGFFTAGMLGKKHSEETLNKMRLSRAGQVITDETKQKLSSFWTGKRLGKDNPMDDPETRRKHQLACLARSSKKKTCPHCAKQYSANSYARWHGDNCKFAP